MRISRVLLASSAVLASVAVPTVASGQAEVRADYIVTFDSPDGASAVRAVGGTITRTFSHALNGVAASLPVRAVAALSRRPGIAAVEADAPVSVDASQSGATWGLDRIDQASLPLNSTYTYNYDGTYNSGVSRVTAYIIDTGIRSTHSEFTGRVGSGYTAISDANGTNDCNGHGTHVAGTVGGTTYGVAKGVQLVPVRVLNCQGSGTTSGVIAGINWAIADHAAGVPAVANMSLGGGTSSALDTAVTNLVNDGVVLAVAAGNSNADACLSSPARAAAPLTVGATDSKDARASYSNFGKCLDLFAPGSSITSAWIGSDTATNTISGTSMATPHVAGVAALVLSAYPTATAGAVMKKITDATTLNKITSVGRNSPNKLLYSLVP